MYRFKMEYSGPPADVITAMVGRWICTVLFVQWSSLSLVFICLLSIILSRAYTLCRCSEWQSPSSPSQLRSVWVFSSSHGWPRRDLSTCSLTEDLQVPDVNIHGCTTCKCYSAYILVQLMCVHVCSIVHVTTCTGGGISPTNCRCSE